MLIQEKLSQAFDDIHGVGFGEAESDRKLIEAETALRKEKNPLKLNEGQAKTLLAVDVLRAFSTDKGITGLTKALDTLEAQHPIGSMGSKEQADIDIIGAELTRHANKFQADLGGDLSLMHEVGILVKEKKWGDAASLIRQSVTEAQARNELAPAQSTKLNQALNTLESGDLNAIRAKVGELKKEQFDLRSSSTGELTKRLARVDKVETAVTRRYVAILKTDVPKEADINPTLKIDVSNVDETETKDFVKTLSAHKDISAVDVRRLQNFQKQVASEWGELDAGVDLEEWSRGDQDKQRFVREAHAVASHVLYLEKQGEVTLSPEQKTYIGEIQRATSATRRAWAEEMISEGRKSIAPTQSLTPEEVKERDIRAEGIEQLVEIGDAQGYIKHSKGLGGRPDLSEMMGEPGVNEKIEELKTGGKVEMSKSGQIVWIGTEDQFFEEVSGLARDVAAIVPEVNQIPFSRSPKARLYQMLMESEAPDGKRESLAWAKDAVFRLYTMGYVKEALWKNGGDVENFTRAALGLLGQGGESSVYSSLNRFHETVKERLAGNEAGKPIVAIDLRDLLDFSEQYSPLKDGKRSWLNAISSGELNEKNGDATSEPARKEFFFEYMKWVLEKQVKMKIITPEESASRLKLIGENTKDKKFEKLFDVYGEYYTNLVKVMQAIHLRYGQVAINQSLEPGTFEFASPPGGEAPYKLHKKTVFKFVTRYVPNNKFGAFLDGEVDTGMTSTLAYARKETMPHFVVDHTAVGANPGADEYFFNDVSNESDRSKFAKQFVNFWKTAMFDTEGHDVNKSEPWKNVRGTDDMRMIEDIKDLARKTYGDWETDHPERLEFVKGMDYGMLSRASGYDFDKIFRENNITDPETKFLFMVDNFGYRYLEWNGLRSKRIGDLYTKYIGKNFAAVYAAAIKLGMNPTNDETIFEAATNIDAFTGGGDFIEDIDKVNAKLNKWTLSGIQLPETSFGDGWLGSDEKGENTRVDLVKKARDKDGNVKRDGAGEPIPEKESFWKNLLTGQLPRTSLAGYYLRHRDPDWMRPFLWEAAYQGGQMKEKVFEQKMKDYKGDMYLGPDIFKIGNFKFRAGYSPLLPMYLLRGWFVDRQHLDKDDFWWITQKTNEKAWEELKKTLGIKM